MAPLLPLKFVGVAEELLDDPVPEGELDPDPDPLAAELPESVVPKALEELDVPEAPELGMVQNEWEGRDHGRHGSTYTVRVDDPDKAVSAADDNVDDALDDVEDTVGATVKEPDVAKIWLMFVMFTASIV